jgi:hypothetical protein
MESHESFIFVLDEAETAQWKATDAGRTALMEQVYSAYGPSNDHYWLCVVSADEEILYAER